MSVVAAERSASGGGGGNGGSAAAKVKGRPPGSSATTANVNATKEQKASTAAVNVMLTTPKMESAGGMSSLASQTSHFLSLIWENSYTSNWI